VTSPALATQSAVIRGLTTAWLQSENAHNGEHQPIAMLLHGFPDGPSCWDLQFSALVPRCQVIAPWARGAGGSKPAGQIARYGSDAVVLDHLAILKKVDPSGTRKVILIGHDLGGVHAINLAHALADRCAGLVIINSLDLAQMARRLATNPRQVLKSWYLGVMQIPLLPEKILGRFEKTFLQRARRAGGLPRAACPPTERGENTVAAPLNQYRAFLREIPRLVMHPRPKLKVPTLILWGANDAFLVPPTQDEMDALAIKPTVRILKGNHWIHRELAGVVNDLITNFLDQLQLKGATLQ